MASFAASSIDRFTILDNEIQLERQVSPQTYCESVGQKAAILGYEKGVFEVWIYPFKIVSDLQFAVSIPHYNLFVQGTEIAKQIIVRPELTTLVFSHDLFCIQWHLLTPLKEPGCIFLFDVDTYTDLELWISFLPNLIPMWPAGLGGQYTLWLDELNSYYIGEGTKKYTGLIGSPMAKRLSNTPGHQLPDEPLKFSIQVSPKLSSINFIPLIVTGGSDGKEKAIQNLINLLKFIPEFYEQKFDYYRRLRSDFITVKTPEPKLDIALEWAKVSLDKGLVNNPYLGKGLVAGYGVSGTSHRPGFAWFFGGDTFLNSLAINGYGDFDTVKKGLTLLRDNQRQDGKILHELTQSAALLHWYEEYPYGFYHAETSAFYIVAIYDYFMCSGDLSFVEESWNSIKLAYHYCVTADEDYDGLMENSVAGLGAMEVGEMLKQNRVDVYLAAIWLQALQCMIKLSQIFNEQELNKKSQQQFDKGYQSFLQLFVDEKNKQLNFALLTDGKKHTDQTVWQSLPLFFDLVESEKVINTMDQFASSMMSTDWGVRGISRNSHYYDPISYNNGSVWPFTTGYVATAQYKHHRAINGWHNLLANARLTWLDALGWHTELLSGEYYRPVSTSAPHQLFSATGIINPLIRGLLGLECDAISRKIKFAPHLPMEWDKLRVINYHCGDDRFDFFIQRSSHKMLLKITHEGQQQHRIIFSPAFGINTQIMSVSVNQQPYKFRLFDSHHDVHCEIECKIDASLTVEIEYRQGVEISLPSPEIRFGCQSTGLKLVNFELNNKVIQIVLEGLAGREYDIHLKTGIKIKKVRGARMVPIDNQMHKLNISFDKQQTMQYVQQKVFLYI